MATSIYIYTYVLYIYIHRSIHPLSIHADIWLTGDDEGWIGTDLGPNGSYMRAGWGRFRLTWGWLGLTWADLGLTVAVWLGADSEWHMYLHPRRSCAEYHEPWSIILRGACRVWWRRTQSPSAISRKAPNLNGGHRVAGVCHKQRHWWKGYSMWPREGWTPIY